MKKILTQLLFIGCPALLYSQTAADWGTFGKYQSISQHDRDVIRNYATTNTEFCRSVCVKQKTALLKLTNDILSREELPKNGDYTDLFLNVTLKTGAGYMDNLLEKEITNVPIIGAIVETAIGLYEENEKKIAQVNRVRSTNTLVDAINRLADEIDDLYTENFTVKIMNIIGDDFLSVNLTSEGIDYLRKLEKATNAYLSSIPSSDEMYISAIENLLSALYQKNSKHGVVSIEIDYRNIDNIENLLISDLQKKPAGVTIQIKEGPYRTKIMNAINAFADKTSFSVMNLKVRKNVTCLIRSAGKDGLTSIGSVTPENRFISTYNPNNPNIYVHQYSPNTNPALGVPLLPLTVLKYNQVNGAGAPATTTYVQLLNAAYDHVLKNAAIYKKFTL